MANFPLIYCIGRALFVEIWSNGGGGLEKLFCYSSFCYHLVDFHVHWKITGKHVLWLYLLIKKRIL